MSVRELREELGRELPRNYYPPQYDIENDKHFNIDDMNFFLGERRSGKTTESLKWNLVRRRLYPIVYCFSKTKHNNFWQQVLPDDKIAGNLSDDELESVLRDIMSDQMKRYQKWKQTCAEGRVTGNPIIKIIFEDYITARTLRKSDAMQEICFNGRHYGISCDIMSQDYIGMSPGERDNMDRFIVYRPDSGRTRNMLRESFGNEFLAVAERVWRDGRAIVINKKKRVPTKERLAWTEGDPEFNKKAIHRNLTLGNAAFWGDVDVVKQKEEFPYVELPSLSTLRGQFNAKIGTRDSPEPEPIEIGNLEGPEEGDKTLEGPPSKKAKITSESQPIIDGDSQLKF